VCTEHPCPDGLSLTMMS